MRVRQRQRPGAFARVAGAIGESGAILGAISLVPVERWSRRPSRAWLVSVGARGLGTHEAATAARHTA